MTIQGYSQVLYYSSSHAAQFTQSLDTAQTASEKAAVQSEYNQVKAAKPVQDFVDEYVPSPQMSRMCESLAMARQKSTAFIDDFVASASMFDALLIAQQKSDIFIEQFLQSSQDADAFVSEFLSFKA